MKSWYEVAFVPAGVHSTPVLMCHTTDLRCVEITVDEHAGAHVDMQDLFGFHGVVGSTKKGCYVAALHTDEEKDPVWNFGPRRRPTWLPKQKQPTVVREKSIMPYIRTR